jgi:hypothetical protein
MIIYGWGKDLTQVAYAGIEKCPNCKNYSHFWVCEHSSHASLYFIKVARWNKKLLFMCQTCERGWEIDAARKEEVLQRTVSLPSVEQCGDMWSRLNASVNKSLVGVGETGKEETVLLISNAITEAVKELKATYQEDHVAYVVSRFIANLQDPDRPK